MKERSGDTEKQRRPSDALSKMTNADIDLSKAVPPDDELRQPHERDESPKAGSDKETSSTPLPRQTVEQAASDVAHGLVDTERRGIPSNVPAPQSGSSSGRGEVPAAGVDRYSTASLEEQKKKPADAERAHVRQSREK